MSAVVFLLVCFLSCSVSEEQTVKSGDDVTLQCQGPEHEAITSLQWIRPDLKKKTEKYVFFFRDHKIFEDYQHPSFRGRVQLMDPQMKNGDVSVILKNVNTKDSGTYECRVSVNNKKSELMNIINLKVKDSGQTSGNTQTEGNLGLKVGLPVGIGILAAVVVGFVFYKRHKGRFDQRI
ncbi:coxsackievirus and adenovirus receptor-like [Scomber japonicus]|uniref:coxsackievirus and adenovirus receptor-like n=1 Tax=Scomber japonicus TaxID=13676 RepID=UPI0023052A84|nr:coxsackievirus and adenovirus receptor-like [Scomber japonicus]